MGNSAAHSDYDKKADSRWGSGVEDFPTLIVRTFSSRGFGLFLVLIL